MEMKVKDRGWVKNAAIIFLAVLLILTFFSNTIMNASLPEVSTKEIAPNSIVAKVRGTGKVEANEAYEVKSPNGIEIRSVLVKAGDEVKVGDSLIVLGEGDSTELEKAKEQLTQLERSYRISVLGISPNDYTLQQMNISQLEQAATDAQIAYYDLISHYDQPLIQSNINRAQKELDRLNADRDAILNNTQQKDETYNNLVAQVQAQELVVENCQNKVADLQEAYDSYTAAQEELDKAESDFNNAKAELEEAQAAAASAPESEKATADALVENAQQRYDASLSVLNAALANPNLTNSSVVPEMAAAQSQLNSEILKLNSLQKQLDQYSISHTAGQTSSLDLKIQETETLILNEKNKLDQIDTARSNLDSAENALNTAYYNLQKQLEADGRSSAITGLNLQEQQEAIEKQKKIIEELSGDASNQILSKVNGKVADIKVSAGKKVNKDDVLMTINVDDLGYTLSMIVTSDQARRLHIGDTATISNYYWGSSITATLDQIGIDAQNPQTNKRLVFSLDGDVAAGQELTLSVGSRSANYDLVVPNSAIRSDSNGSFILKVVSKNSPLGNRYTATRVSVEVIASDDTNSAITGDVNAYDYVITTSNKPVKDKDLIKIS